MKRIKRQVYAKMYAKLRRDGFSYAEIAERLGVSISTVKRLARDARPKEQTQEHPKYSEALVEVSRYAVMDCENDLWRAMHALQTVAERGAFHPEECKEAANIIGKVAMGLRRLK